MNQTLKDQARQVEQRLRKTTHMSDRNGFLIAADTIAALITALEAAEKDAARWAWFRKEVCIGDMATFETAFACFDGVDECTKDEFDAAIDAAIAQGAKK